MSAATQPTNSMTTAIELLRAIVQQAGQIDHNLPLPDDFWAAYRAADEFLAGRTIDGREHDDFPTVQLIRPHSINS